MGPAVAHDVAAAGGAGLVDQWALCASLLEGLLGRSVHAGVGRAAAGVSPAPHMHRTLLNP